MSLLIAGGESFSAKESAIFTDSPVPLGHVRINPF